MRCFSFDLPDFRRSNHDPAGTVSYNAEHIIGNGSFGVVFQAVVVETGEVVAIKKVRGPVMRRYFARKLGACLHAWMCR